MKTKGFTLIELLVVVAIVAILTGVVYTAIHNPDKVVDGYRVRVVGGCEYLVNGVPPNEVLTHKGNCTNAIHLPSLER